MPAHSDQAQGPAAPLLKFLAPNELPPSNEWSEWHSLIQSCRGCDTGVNYYDGQGFMVKKELGVKSAIELDGATVCVQTGSTTELNLADYFRSNNMTFQPIITEDAAESRLNFEKGACDVYTTDASQMAAQRSAMQDPNAFLILPEIISNHLHYNASVSAILRLRSSHTNSISMPFCFHRLSHQRPQGA